MRERAAVAIAGGAVLAGAGSTGAPSHGVPLRKHQEREEVTASPSLALAWPGKSPRGCSMAGGHEAHWCLRPES